MAEPYRLSPEQIRFYREEGYLQVEGFLTPAECERYNAEAEKKAQGHYHNYLHFHEEVPAFHELILNPRLHDICDQLQDHRMIPIGSIYFFCKPNNPLENGSVPHQDNYSPKSPPGSYFVASVAFDDADEKNGALVVYPKTHLLGELPGQEKKNFEYDAKGQLTTAYPIGNECRIPEGYAPLTLNYKKGSALFLHSLLVHSAPKNVNPDGRWRRQIYLHFIKDGHPFWPGWNAKRQIMDRGPRRI